MPNPPITACEWRVGPPTINQVRVVERGQMDGSVLYAVKVRGWVADHDACLEQNAPAGPRRRKRPRSRPKGAVLTTLQYTGQLVVTKCWCGMRHAIPKELNDHQEQQHRDGYTQDGIYCPLGHSYIISGEGEAERLRKQLEWAQQRAQAERDLREDTERRLIAQKGQTTKARKRAAAAVCPCCNRSFVQLRRHMATKHPDYDPERAT